MTQPTAYDVLVEQLAAHEAKPYCIRLGRRDWTELRRDPRTMKALEHAPGDPAQTFMGVPVRIEKGRITGIPQKFGAEVYQTAEELHDAVYG